MKIYYSLLLLTFVLLTNAQNPVRLNISDVYNSKQEIKISEIGQSIKYVQLETTSNNLFSKINKIIMDDLIYVNAREGVFVFTHEGKFVTKISNKGKGPKEYNSKVDFDINNKKVAMLDVIKHKIMIFQNDGTYLKSIDYQNINNKVYMTNNSCYTLNTTPLGFWGEKDSGVLLNVYDNDGEIYTLKNRNTNLPSCCKNNYKFNDCLYFRQPLNDTVFSFFENAIFPEYIIDLGKYKAKKAIGHKNDVSKVISCSRITETDQFLFLWLRDWNKVSTLCIFNKKMKTLKTIPSSGFQNDIDTGISIFPESITNNKIVNSLWYHNIYELVNEKKVGQSLANIFEKMDMNSNPVLMIVNLKE